MPPKKNINGKTEAAAKKTPKKPREKKEKPKLKIPTVIKIKIGAKNNINNLSTKTTKANKLSKKQLALQTKLDLANEVATAQLVKPKLEVDPVLEVATASPSVESPVPPTSAPVPPKITAPEPPGIAKPPRAKRGRKKKIVEEQIAINGVVDSDDSFEASSAEKRSLREEPKMSFKKLQSAIANGDAFQPSAAKKKCLRKDPKMSPKKLDIATAQESQAKKPLSITPKKATKSPKPAEVNKEVTKTNKKSPVVCKKSSRNKTPGAEPKTRKRKILPKRGKTDVTAEASINVGQSPSILDHIADITPKKETLSFESSADLNVEARPIDSRKTSLTSECLSWTKDISSSSTTTCVTVCSTDFVRIDRKLPILKITNIDHKLPKAKPVISRPSFSSSTGSESSASEPTPNCRLHTPEVESRSLNLSTSSVTPTKSTTHSVNSHQNSAAKEDMEKLSYVLDKLTSKLKKIDLEIINWIGSNNEDVNIDVKKIQGKIFKVLKEENEVFSHCQQLKIILSNNNNVTNETRNDVAIEQDTNSNKNNAVHSIADIDKSYDVSPAKVIEGNNSPAKIANDSVKFIEENKSLTNIANFRSEGDENNDNRDFAMETAKSMTFDQSCDDDDALSLFAESLTDMVSSRRNSIATSICNTGELDKFEPPAKEGISMWQPAKRISYPRAITFNIEKPNLDIKTKAVCEKQNADSTSIYKDTEQHKNTAEFHQSKVENHAVSKFNAHVNNTNRTIKKPTLISSIFNGITVRDSSLFGNVCFYFLVSSCRREGCRFLHQAPALLTMKTMLERLAEDVFMQEYLLLRNWPELRRLYGVCFVEECKRRDLTRYLVEMAIDFITKAKENNREDSILKVIVQESVLLHLNTVDLESCADLLMYNVYKNVPLCDVFIGTIANTQNFSRFKPVFLTLTRFILTYKGTFDYGVATQILERLVILPCELPLLEALLAIIKNTNRAILNNTMIGVFEKQLMAFGKELHNQFLELKKDAAFNRPVLTHLYESPQRLVAPEVEVPMQPLVTEREKRYTSPDTTNLDNMNKTTDEPVVTFDQAHLLSIPRSFNNSNSSFSNESSEDIRPLMTMNPNYMNYRNIMPRMPGPGYNHMRRMSPIVRHGGPRPPLIQRNIHQQLFRPRPPQYVRRPGPDFF